MSFINNGNTLLRPEELDNVAIAGVDSSDYPDMCDSYLESAEVRGVELTESEIDYINDNFSDWIQELAREQVVGG